MERLVSEHVRRVWLRHGGDFTATAGELGVRRQTVQYHVRRANERAPLAVEFGVRWTDVSEEDRAAIVAYLAVCRERAGLVKMERG